MSDPIKITNHAVQALDRLAEQYRLKKNLAAVFNAWNRQTQELENAFWDLLSLRSVDTAQGVSLDVLGKIVKELRGGSADPEYRLRIRARIRSNLSNGTVEDVYSVFRALLGTAGLGAKFGWLDQFPAGFIFSISNYAITPQFVKIFAGFLRTSRGAAIEAHFHWQETDDAHAFCFDGGSGLGFGSTADPNIGGALTGIAGA